MAGNKLKIDRSKKLGSLLSIRVTLDNVNVPYLKEIGSGIFSFLTND